MLQKKKHQQKQPCIFFTVVTLTVLKNALLSLALLLTTRSDRIPNVPFAKETLAGLQAKVQALDKQYAQAEDISFDYNEVILISASLILYLVELQNATPSPTTSQQIQACEQLCRYFKPLVGRLEPHHL